MTTATYAVKGLTCGLCIGKVMERVRLIPGVTAVQVALVHGGPSPLVVTSAAVSGEEVRRAVEQAGFDLRDAQTLTARRPRQTGRRSGPGRRRSGG